ncbi:MAG: hypothetical protein RJA81_1577 [Planctomycetota bacterium]|jgi:peroxiredoxin family protein
MDNISISRAELQELIDKAVADRVSSQFSAMQEQIQSLQQTIASQSANIPEDRATIVVFGGELDTIFAACTIASGAVAMGMEASMFFTFWGLNALRTGRKLKGKSLPEKMVAMMMPSGPGSVPTSRMNMAGMGPKFFRYLMNQKKVESVPGMIALVQELGVRLVACEMSMGVMGLTREELLPGIDYGGVATYLGDAGKSKITLFI